MSDTCNTDCGSCSVGSCSDRTQEQTDFTAAANAASNVKKVYGILSGKGGVGKSLVTSMLAVMMNRKGYKTAVFDADITGPSIPNLFGIAGTVMQSSEGIIPAESKNAIKVMSINLLLENTTDPVIWRGALVSNVVKQFWTDVAWGDIDYMFVDMPPGTGDVPLTVFQSLPVDGLIIVTSPQDLVSMIAAKAVGMAKMMNVPIIAMVENMSYFECPSCNSIHKIFGESKIDEVAKEHGIDLVAKLPINPKLAELSDKGTIENFEGAQLAGIVEFLEKQ